jgi:hypothetical protein
VSAEASETILFVRGVEHTPRALRIGAQGCRVSGYPGYRRLNNHTLKGLRRAGVSMLTHHVARDRSSATPLG